MKNNTILNQRTMNKPFYRWTIGTLFCMLGVLLTACNEEIEYDQLYHDMKALNEWRVGTKVADESVEHYSKHACFTSVPISDGVFARMSGKSYPEDCTIPRDDLRYVKALHKNAKGETIIGELVCHKDIADDLADIFLQLYEAGYPIERMTLIDNYDADDERSMTANNTSAFCYRTVAGSTKLSTHSRGLAVDINPLYNPYVKSKTDGTLLVQPAAGEAWADRTAESDYRLDWGDLCYTVFKQHGFEWGGDWKYSKDYQHFEKVVDNTTAWDYNVVEESVDESGESASYAVLAYTTKDAHGNNVSATGTVCWFEGQEHYRYINLCSHYTQLQAEPTFLEQMMLTDKESVLFLPHYIGYHGSKDEPHPYLNMEVQARTQTDFIRPAMQYIYDHGILYEPDYFTISTGYSQGGAVALAVQRAIEADEDLQFLTRFAGTFSGAAPYSPWLTFKSYITAEEVVHPCGVLLTLASMTESYPALFGSIKAEDYMSEALRKMEPLELLARKDLTTDDYNEAVREAVGSLKPEALFSSAVFDENSPEMKVLKRALEWNDLTTGWTPKHPIVYTRSADDAVIPAANQDQLLKAFSSTGLLKHYQNDELTETGSHGIYGFSWLTYLFMHTSEEISRYLPDAGKQ